MRVLSSGLDRRWGSKRSGQAAERYSQFLLWVFISAPLRYCPQCGGVRDPSPHESRRVREAAAEDLASGLERDIAPSLDDLLKGMLLDLYPRAPYATAVVTARALMLMARVVADTGLLTRRGVTLASKALHTQMIAVRTVRRATSAVDEAARWAVSNKHRRLSEDEERHVVWLHDED